LEPGRPEALRLRKARAIVREAPAHRRIVVEGPPKHGRRGGQLGPLRLPNRLMDCPAPFGSPGPTSIPPRTPAASSRYPVPLLAGGVAVEDGLDVVAIRVEHVRGVVARAVLGPDPRRSVVTRAGLGRRGVEGVHLVRA